MRNKRGYSRDVMSCYTFLLFQTVPRATLYVTETSETEDEADTRDTTLATKREK